MMQREKSGSFPVYKARLYFYICVVSVVSLCEPLRECAVTGEYINSFTGTLCRL
jgi:hypothetical protein